MFHLEAFVPVMVLLEVSRGTSMRVPMILFKESRRASVRMAVYMNMPWSRVNNNRRWMNKNWGRFYYN
jgi:hypothetical protein